MLPIPLYHIQSLLQERQWQTNLLLLLMLTSLLLALKPCSSLRISRLPLNRVKGGSRGPMNDKLLRLVTTTSDAEIKVLPKKDGCEIDLSLSALALLESLLMSLKRFRWGSIIDVSISLVLVTYFYTLFTILDHSLPIVSSSENFLGQRSSTQVLPDYSFAHLEENVRIFFFFHTFQ